MNINFKKVKTRNLALQKPQRFHLLVSAFKHKNIYSKLHMHIYVHCSTQYSNFIVESTQMSKGWWVTNENVGYIKNGILCRHKQWLMKWHTSLKLEQNSRMLYEDKSKDRYQTYSFMWYMKEIDEIKGGHSLDLRLQKWIGWERREMEWGVWKDSLEDNTWSWVRKQQCYKAKLSICI